MGPPDDETILSRFRTGDQDGAFRLLVDTHGEAVYNVALFTLNDEIEAQDATQETFIRIYRGLSKFRGQARLSTWIYRIVKNVCYDHLKRWNPLTPGDWRNGEPRDDGQPDPGEQHMTDYRHHQVRQALAQLPPQQRIALTLYYFQDRSYEELAAIMQQPLNTVKSHLYRGKAALEKYLQPLEGSLV